MFSITNFSSNVDSFDSYLQNTLGTDSQVELQANLPATWDIRVNGPGKIEPIKNQGTCGACWAFAVTTTVENRRSINQKDYKLGLTALSEQQLIDCVYRRDGCTGGKMEDAYQYVIDKGLTFFYDYPYMERYQYSCRIRPKSEFYKIQGYQQLPNDINAIKQALVNKGAIAVYLDSSKWYLYQGGIFEYQEPQQKITKAVTIIGYGPNYWLIRESFGTLFGEQGYMRIASQGKGAMSLQYAFQPI